MLPSCIAQSCAQSCPSQYGLPRPPPLPEVWLGIQNGSKVEKNTIMPSWDWPQFYTARCGCLKIKQRSQLFVLLTAFRSNVPPDSAFAPFFPGWHSAFSVNFRTNTSGQGYPSVPQGQFVSLSVWGKVHQAAPHELVCRRTSDDHLRSHTSGKSWRAFQICCWT